MLVGGEDYFAFDTGCDDVLPGLRCLAEVVGAGDEGFELAGFDGLGYFAEGGRGALGGEEEGFDAILGCFYWRRRLGYGDQGAAGFEDGV